MTDTIDYKKPLETPGGKPVRLLSDEPLKGWESADILPGIIIMDGRTERACEVLRHSDEVRTIVEGRVRRYDIRNAPPRMVPREAWGVMCADSPGIRFYWPMRQSAENFAKASSQPAFVVHMTWQGPEQ
jgi:hypothetical protein